MLQQSFLDMEEQTDYSDMKDNKRDLTSTIQTFVQYAEDQGSSNANRYYTSINRLIRAESGTTNIQLSSKHSDDIALLKNLYKVARKAMIHGMEWYLPYKEIYQQVKKEVRKVVASSSEKPLV
jgi:23S rRNA A2030 N6-methylase RlmJ